MSDDFEVLEPSTAEVEYRGERLVIQPLTIGQLPRLVRMARPVLDSLLGKDNLPAMAAGEAMRMDGDFVGQLMDLIGDHGEAVYAAAALCVGRDAEWVAGGDLAEFIALAGKVIEVNRDFFTRKLAPLLAGRMGPTAASRATGAGPTPSSA